MRCRYCFYADVSAARDIKNHGIMPYVLLETLVQKALSEVRGYCQFAFQGGEPTLAGLDFFRKLVELEKKYNVNNARVSYALQTNGLLIDDAWAAFFKENGFLIGLSIDSFKQVHDGLRQDAAGKGTHSRCIEAAKILTEHRVQFNILSVVTRQLAEQPNRVYRFYKQHGFRYIQFIPCLDGMAEGSGANEYSLRAKAFSKFLCRIFDLWHADFIKNDYYSIRAFDNYIHMLAGRPPENCAMNGVCNAYALVEANGSVYPCDFYAVDRFLLGNVATHNFKEMLQGDSAEAFITPSMHVNQACKVCEYFYICRGGCRRDREPLNNGVLSGNRYCEAYKMFFEHALPRMMEIARAMQSRT
ncbi:MAG: anaerobic sulfatase maturase [Defluviitaleaceae bacterium]|nr:anaerobic sulfatase maturase [Defluviitaleaceae bacterium]